MRVIRIRRSPRRQGALEDVQGFRKHPGDGHPRIEAGDRVLEDDLQLAPPAPQRRGIAEQKIHAAPEHLASRGPNQPEDRPRQRGLSGSRFTDQTERLTRVDLETHRAERSNAAIVHSEPPHVEQRAAHVSG